MMAALLLACIVTRGYAATDIDPRLKVFAAQKRQQTEELAAKLHLDVPPEAREFFTAAEGGDWNAVSNCFGRIWRLTGRSEANPLLPGLDNVLYVPIRETLGAYEQFQAWDGTMVRKFADGVLGSIPAGSIYFGGTDPGHFITTVTRDAAKSPDIFVTSQTLLPTSHYVDYLRLVYGSRIWIPSEKDCQEAFQQCVEESSAAKRVGGIKDIVDILAKTIFDHNRDKHEFYVEESFVIPWMYPYLEPHGLIMKLNKEPLSQLDPAVVARDRQFWDALTKELLTDPKFLRSEPARKSFAKLRTAIARLYAYRHLVNEAEATFKQAVELGPATVEPAFGLAYFYSEAGRFDDAVAVLEQFQTCLSAADLTRQHIPEAIAQIREKQRQAADKPTGAKPISR